MNYAADANFGSMSPVGCGWGGDHDPEAHPNLLVDFAFDGVSFGKMHKDAVPVFTALLTELVPLIPGGLVAGACGCYNPASTLQDGSRSFHTYGIAIDVNWNVDPMGAPTRPTGPHTVPAAASGIARKYGCQWGGDWNDPRDWMHFEIHLPPAIARTVEPEDDLSAADVWDEGIPNTAGINPIPAKKRLAAIQAGVNQLLKLVDPEAIAAAVAAKLPAGAGSLTKADVEAALRDVFADAGSA